MRYKIFDIDINTKIRKMKECIDKEDPIPNNFVDILIREYEKQAKMIELMAKDISNFGKTNSENIIDYYKKEAQKCLKMKKY